MARTTIKMAWKEAGESEIKFTHHFHELDPVSKLDHLRDAIFWIENAYNNHLADLWQELGKTKAKEMHDPIGIVIKKREEKQGDGDAV